MALTRGQILTELDRRGKLPAQFRSELADLHQNGDKEFLATLPPARAAVAQAIAEGRMSVPSGMALRSAAGQQMLADLAQYRPGFNAADAKSQAAMRVSATSGKIGQNLASFNTALGHLDNLAKSAENLHNSGVPLLNKAALGFDSELNGNSDYLAAQRKFTIDRQAAADELTRAFRQSGGNLADVQGWEHSINGADSPKSLRSAIGEAATLLRSRIDAIGDQYSQGMGTASSGLSLLNPHARQALQMFQSPTYAKAGYDAAVKEAGSHGQPPSSGGTGGGVGFGSGGPTPNRPGDGGSGGMEVATGATRTEHDQKAEGLIEQLIRSGQSADQINAALATQGIQSKVLPKQVANAQAYLKQHPDYAGFVSSTREVPNSLLARAAASPVGSFVLGAADAGLGGLSDEAAGGIDALVSGKPFAQAVAEANQKKQDALGLHPFASGLGNLAGNITGAVGAGSLLKAAGVTGRVLPYAAGGFYGAVSGAGQDNDSRLTGALLSGGLGVAGTAVGEALSVPAGALLRTRPAQALRGMFGRGPDPVAAPSTASSIIANAATKGDPAGIQATLAEAQRLGVPMSLADTSPSLRSLAGAAVRRSPVASGIAEDALLPRSNGQIDRFGQAITRDLGPTDNIPQLSADLNRQAQQTAAPLYADAYSKAVPSTPDMDRLLATPFGRQALGRANTIAANEQRSPTELGFALDADGNISLNPRPNDLIARHLDARTGLDDAQMAYRTARGDPRADLGAARDRLLSARDTFRQADQALAAAPDPTTAANVPAYTTQTLDYVKRGMDDVLEQYRNPVTNKLQLDEAGKAQAGVRGAFVDAVDQQNPAYAAARAAYAGPAASRDALARGTKAVSLNPDELGIQVANQSPEHLGQMQLGFQSGLLKKANDARFASNPFDLTLGTPAMEQRLATLYPDNPGVSNLLRQRDLERTLAQNTTDILGNSKTAQRGIADQAFAGSPMLEAGVHAGAAAMTHGATLPVTALRLGAAALKSDAVKDRIAFGFTGSPTAKADALAPLLLNTDPAQSSALLDQILQTQQAYKDYVIGLRPKRLTGMFGQGVGISTGQGF